VALDDSAGPWEILVASPVGSPHENRHQNSLVAVIIGRFVDFTLALFARIAHFPDGQGHPALVLLQPRNHATGLHRSGCTVAQLQKSVWKAARLPGGAGKTTPACDGVRKAPPASRVFLELATAHLDTPWSYDEPEILRYSNRQFAPIGADAGQASIRRPSESSVTSTAQAIVTRASEPGVSWTTRAVITASACALRHPRMSAAKRYER